MDAWLQARGAPHRDPETVATASKVQGEGCSCASRHYWKHERPSSATRLLFLPARGDKPFDELTLQKTFTAAAADARLQKHAIPGTRESPLQGFPEPLRAARTRGSPRHCVARGRVSQALGHLRQTRCPGPGEGPRVPRPLRVSNRRLGPRPSSPWTMSPGRLVQQLSAITGSLGPRKSKRVSHFTWSDFGIAEEAFLPPTGRSPPPGGHRMVHRVQSEKRESRTRRRNIDETPPSPTP